MLESYTAKGKRGLVFNSPYQVLEVTAIYFIVLFSFLDAIGAFPSDNQSGEKPPSAKANKMPASQRKTPTYYTLHKKICSKVSSKHYLRQDYQEVKVAYLSTQ